MKPNAFLAVGVIWLMVGIVLFMTGFGIGARGANAAAVASRLFHLTVPVLFLGWIVPVALGLWLKLKR